MRRAALLMTDVRRCAACRPMTAIRGHELGPILMAVLGLISMAARGLISMAARGRALTAALGLTWTVARELTWMAAPARGPMREPA